MEADAHFKTEQNKAKCETILIFLKTDKFEGDSKDSDNNTNDKKKITVLKVLPCLIIKLSKECYKEDIKYDDVINGLRLKILIYYKDIIKFT